MYLDFYRFREEPFHITADPAFLYLSPSHKEALGAIIYGISRRKGFVAISGEVGVGKTTILKAYLEGADLPARPDTQKVVYIFNANLSFTGLLHTLCRELDREPPAGEAYEVVNFLHAVLIQEYRQGNTVVLVIDEVQNMPLDTLENLRMLSNLETSREKLIQIVLVGQPEFDARLKRPELRQLNQRIAIRARIQSLTRRESLEYLYHRLSRVTNAPHAAFTPSALRLIARHSKGAPRVLNILSDNALIAGYGYQKKPVTPAIVRETIADYRGKRRFGKMRWILVPITLALLVASLLLSPGGKSLFSGTESLVRLFHMQMMKMAYPGAGTKPGSLTVTAPPANAISPKPQAMEPIPEPQQAFSEKKIADISEPETGTSKGPIEPEPRAAVPPPEPAAEPLKPLNAPLKTEKPTRHVVRKGETLILISRGVYGASDSGTLDSILAQNPQIDDPNRIFPGDSLILPDRPTPNP